MKKNQVIVVGAGVAGLSAALFTARADLSTMLINCGSSILNRNAHLENYPGFPDGIDPRLLLTMIEDQVESAGAGVDSSTVTKVTADEKFRVHAGGTVTETERLILTSWSDLSPVEDLAVEQYKDGGKRFVRTDNRGETAVDGLYAAGRIAGTHHQTIVAAGDGARVGLNVIEDLKPDFYHDWVAPEGYFTDRGRDVPQGCEEISEDERMRRTRQGKQTLIDYLASSDTEDPTPHPSQLDDTNEEC
ncbi:MAG: FAD-dependent oxidoreductase [bacterium]